MTRSLLYVEGKWSGYGMRNTQELSNGIHAIYRELLFILKGLFGSIKLNRSDHPKNMLKPHVIMIAGPNGAGKTSTAMTLLPNFLQVNEFVNADEIAYGLSPLNSESMAIEAGRLMLKRISTLIANKKSFAFETTGAAKTHLHTLEQCHKFGYQCDLIYLYLSSPELAIDRVKLRVAQGGHNIPEKDIIRRYHRSLQMIFSEYVHVVDNSEVFDNSFGDVRLAAEKRSTEASWTIHLPETWNRIRSHVHEKSN